MTKKSEKKCRRSERLNGKKKRGLHGRKGRWIDSKEAFHLSKQNENPKHEEWWNDKWLSKSRHWKKVKVRQYDKYGPDDKPFWLYDNGDMYLGEWTTPQNEDCFPVEEGIGIAYINKPEAEMKGLVCIGQWKGGLLNGNGKSIWLKKSKIWKNNHLPHSPITKVIGNTKYELPFRFEGCYINSLRNGKGKLHLKHGSITAKGQWQDGSPVGQWWESVFQSSKSPQEKMPKETTLPQSSADNSGRSKKRKFVNDRQRSQKQVRQSEEIVSNNEVQNVKPKSSVSSPRTGNVNIKEEYDVVGNDHEGNHKEKVNYHSISESSAPCVPSSIEVAPEKPRGALSELADLESKMGINQLELNVIERLENLETMTYGTVSTGALVPRLNAIKETLFGSS